MKLALQLALKGLRRSWRQYLSVALILFVGFLGPLFAASIKTSADHYLRGKAREILGADLVLSSLRPFKAEEVAEARRVLTPTQVSRETQFLTMGSGPSTTSSILLEVRGVDESFPIYGRVRVRTKETTSPEGEVFSAAALEHTKMVWVFPEVLVQLRLKIGDQLRLGQSEFLIAGEILEGPGAFSSGMDLAPQIYIGQNFIEQTGLIQYGSQVRHRVYFELPSGADPAIAATLAKTALPDPDIFQRTPDDSIQGLERFTQFFERYLSIVTLVAFALSWMSAFYILQIFLLDRLRDAAAVMILGGSRVFVASINVLQVVVVSLFALAVATAVVSAAIWIGEPWLEKALPSGFVLAVHAADLFRFVIIALASAFTFTLPFCLRLFRLKPRVLLEEGSLNAGGDKMSWGLRLIAYMPMLLVFAGLSTWSMGSWSHGGYLLGGLIAASLLSWAVGRGLFAALFAFSRHRPGRLRLVATQLSRGRFGTDLCFLALTFSALTVNLVPNLLSSVTAEIQPKGGRELPSLFLFNIPEGSVADLETYTREGRGELRYLSPMILARLQKVNDQAVEKDFFQKFPVRVSYREKLFPSEKVIEGKEITERFDAARGDLPEISMEIKYAERNGFKIGDKLEFDIQGVPQAGRIVNFRRIKWTDFHPNFFMEFQTGVLEDAPKTWISTINLPDDVNKAEFQAQLIHKFPDLSVIDIGRTLERVSSIVDTMIGPIRTVAWIAVVISFMVLIAVISHNLRLRGREFDIMKILGADRRLISGLISSEYAWLSGLGVLTGSLAAIAISTVVSLRMLDIENQIAWLASAGSFVLMTVLTLVIAWRAARRALMHAGFASGDGSAKP